MNNFRNGMTEEIVLKKVLPIADPPIKSYLHHAYGLSILATRNDYLPWFHSNYIQWYFDKNFMNNRYVDYFNFFYYPYVEVNFPHLDRLKIDRMMLSEDELNVDFFARLIDMGYYVCTYVDEYYIPNRVAYHNYNLKHEILIHGYDRTAQVFHVLGFDQERVYRSTTVPFNDFMEAHDHGYEGKEDLFWRRYIIPARLFDNAEYSFNIELVTVLLEDYLESKNSNIRISMSTQSPRDSVFGLKCYEYVDQVLALMEKGEFFIDYRIPTLIWEHKHCMNMRLNYMHSLGLVDRNVCDQYAQVEADALTARNTILRAFVTNQLSIISKVRQLVKSVHDKERAVLYPLLQQLKSNN